MKKTSVNSTKKRNKIIYNDKIQKSRFLNSTYLLSEYHRNFFNNLNNAYRNYQINSCRNDRMTDNNLRNIGFQRILDMKKKLKHSNQMLKKYDDKYIYNRIGNKTKKNISEVNLINNSDKIEEDELLNISNINKKQNEDKKDNSQENDNINKEICSNKNENSKINKRKRNSQSYNFKNHSTIIQRTNIYNKYLLITRDIEMNSKRMKKIDKLTNLYEQIDIYNKRQINLLKEDKKPIYYSNYREKIEKKRPKSTINRNKHKLWIPKNNHTKNKSFKRCSSAFNQINESTSNKNRKIISNYFNKSYQNKTCELSQIYSNKSNIISTGKQKGKIKYSSPSSLNSSQMRHIIQSPLILSTRNKMKYSISKIACESNKEIESIAYKTINDANKINSEVRKNYSSHNEPKIKIKKNYLAELLNDTKIDLVKLRTNLKLKDSNGLLGEINEIEILEKDLKRMSKMLNKTNLNILKPIARGLIHKDLILNKRLIYNVGIEHRKSRKKYFKLYDILNNLKIRQKIVENYIID